MTRQYAKWPACILVVAFMSWFARLSPDLALGVVAGWCFLLLWHQFEECE